MIGHPPRAYGPMADDIQRVLISQEEIETRVLQLGEAISRDYAGLNPLLIGVLKGVVPFLADLLRAITIPVEVDYLDIARFRPGAQAQPGAVRLAKDLNAPIEGRHVLFVEDVIDTGMTLNYLLRNIRTRDPASLEVCTFFNKPVHRLVDIPLKYKGFDLPDKFVVGYGLDYREKYRNLPFVGLLRAHVIQNQVTGNSRT
ncbi:MAG: hypoxanthine phosphoribosyltransferase [Chloroflexota bacterium]